MMQPTRARHRAGAAPQARRRHAQGLVEGAHPADRPRRPLDAQAWPQADTAYRSKANLDLLDQRGLRPEFQRARPRGRPMPAHIARGNATRARVRRCVEHVFAAEKQRMGLLVRCVGLVRATARITLANLAYNMRRLARIEGRGVPA